MKKTLLSLAALALMAGSAFAQYYYIPDQGTNPKGLNADPEYPEGGGQATGWTRILTGPATTPVWSSITALPTGFVFEFNGVARQAFKVSSSGVLTFTTSATTVPSNTKADLPAAEIPDNSVCIWGLSSLADNDHIYTKTFGTAPNRQFWIHFSSYSYGTSASTGNNFTYWSIVLEETTNRIYIIDQRTGGYTAAVKVVSAGIQINSTTAYKVDGSPNLEAKAGVDASSVDNTFYEFMAGTQPAIDLKGTSVNVEENLALPQGPFDIRARFRNVGTTAITSGTFNYSIDGGATVSSPLSSVNIAKFDYYTALSATKWAPTAAGTYVIKAWISAPNGSTDGATANDTAVMSVKVWENFVARKSLFEVYTSSTCPPCLPGNQVLDGVLNNNPGKFSVIKYQYNFPGTGDPYYTLEAAVRGNYYGGINSVPRLQIDGQWNSNPNSFTQSIFDQYQKKPAFVTITPTQVVSGQKITVTAVVRPVVALAGNYVIRMAVVERKTTRNVKTNGETEFHWVMKKMLPDPIGVLIPLTNPNGDQTFTQEFDFPGNYKLAPNATAPIDLATEHSVEEFDDLITVVFIQNDATKEVIQSEWSSKGIYSGKNEMAVSELGAVIYPNPAKTSFSVKLETAQSAGVKVFDLTGKEVINRTITEFDSTIDCSTLKNGIYMVELTVDGKTVVKKLNVAH